MRKKILHRLFEESLFFASMLILRHVKRHGQDVTLRRDPENPAGVWHQRRDKEDIAHGEIPVSLPNRNFAQIGDADIFRMTGVPEHLCDGLRRAVPVPVERREIGGIDKRRVDGS